MTDTDDDLQSETLVGDIRDKLRAIFERQDMSWGMMPETHQRSLTKDVEGVARAIVKRSIELVSAKGRPVIRARMGNVTHNTKGVIEGKLELPSTDAHAYDVFMAANASVLLVVTDIGEYDDEREPAKIMPDQKRMLD